MTAENEPRPQSAMEKFFSIPSEVREEFIRRGIADYNYLLIRGYNRETMPEGSILPNGNKVMKDEKGNKYFLAPDITKPISTPADN